MPRVMIANLRTGEHVEMPFTPPELTEDIAVEYARQQVVGMSHTILNYANTANHSFKGLEFGFVGTANEAGAPFSALARPVDRLAEALDTRRFLMSLCYPSATAQGVRDGGPPRVLFSWPAFVSMTCILANLSITHHKFDVFGRPTHFTARVDLEEIRDVRLTSETVRQVGTLRSNDAPTEE
jgi:hypothetical protein